MSILKLGVADWTDYKSGLGTLPNEWCKASSCSRKGFGRRSHCILYEMLAPYQEAQEMK